MKNILSTTKTIFLALWIAGAVACSDEGSNDGPANPNTQNNNGGSDDGAGGNTGTGGSLARFTIVGDFFYAISNTELMTYELGPEGALTERARQNVGQGVETMFPYQGQLLLGSRNGVFVYDLSNPATPQRIGAYERITSCDPIVARDGMAFSTLRSGDVGCDRGVNRLEVLELPEGGGDPVLKSTYGELEQPKGLGIKDNILYVCDGDRGVIIFDVSEVYDGDDDYAVEEMDAIPGFEASDVIVQDELLLVIAVDGLRQYDISQARTPRPLSTIPVNAQ